MRAFEKGDLATARSAEFRATEMVRALSASGFTAASKAVMAFVGVDCGPVRAVTQPVTRRAPCSRRQGGATRVLREAAQMVGVDSHAVATDEDCTI